MNGLLQTIRIALMLSTVFAGRQVLAGDDGERQVAVEINKANGLLRSGDVDGAVKAYHQVQSGAPERTHLSYNMAVAQYRKGDMAAAEGLFKQAAASENDALAAKARYNLGNCNYAAALRSAENDHPAAIKGLEKAIENYRSALEIDPNDADSRANIELASAMIDKLREQEKKQQQKKDQQQKQQDQKQQDKKQQQYKDKQDQKNENNKQQENQEKKDSQQQNKEQQNKEQKQSQQNNQQKSDSSQDKKSQGEQSSKDKEQQKNGENSKNQSGDKPEQMPREQKSKEQESKAEQKDSKSESQSQEQVKKDSADQKQEPKSQDQSQQQKQQRQSQASSKQNSKDQRPEKEEATQSEPVKDQQGKAAPKGALSAADEKAGKEDPKTKEAVGKPEIVPDGAMTTQEAEKMLQAIRDQEMLRRLKRQATERNQHVPVDRDW